MLFCDYHVHTNFSDGSASPEQMVLAAVEKGMPELGISDHSYTDWDESYCVPRARIEEYRAEIGRLREKYSGRIKVFCGIEQDVFSSFTTEGYDYSIGSVHAMKRNGVYVYVDWTPEEIRRAVAEDYGGDPYLLVRDYFETAARVIELTDADIIGHFDLVSKFSEIDPVFDAEDPRYVSAWRDAADELLKTGKPFELNTGGIFRGCRSEAYPSSSIRRYIIQRGGRFILSSDAHSPEGLCFGFEEQRRLLEAEGAEVLSSISEI